MRPFFFIHYKSYYLKWLDYLKLLSETIANFFFVPVITSTFHWLHFITNYSFFLFPRVITNLLKYPHGQFSSLISVSIYIFNNSNYFGYIYRRRKWQPTPIFLLLKSHGQRSLTGYRTWVWRELDPSERLTHIHI